VIWLARLVSAWLSRVPIEETCAEEEGVKSMA